MDYSQFLIEKIASWLADNFSNFQLETLFRKYNLVHLYTSGTNKYSRTLSALGEIVHQKEAEHIMKDILEKIGERINWKMLNGHDLPPVN